MRISTGMIFDAGVAGINGQTASLLHLQQQVASGRRIVTPSDDPVAAAQALQVTQASDANVQFKTNQGYATSALGLEDGQLSGASDLLLNVHDLAVQAQGPSLTASGRQGIATALRSDFGQLLGIANATDGAGQYMFAGFMGATQPFGGSVDGILASSPMVSPQIDGQQTLQVSPSRFLAVSDSGNAVFNRIPNGNGYFVTDYARTPLLPNTGTGVISSGSVTNPAAWSVSPTKNVSINFSIDTVAVPPVTYYDIVNATTGNSMLTGALPVLPPTAATGQRVYQSGQPIALTFQSGEQPFDLGSSVTVSGAPVSGDSFSIAPSTSQSIFVTLANLIGALEAPGGTPPANAKYSSDINTALTNLDHAISNISQIRAGVGSRMNEITALGTMNDNLNLQYKQTLSNLQDVDYTKAVTDLTRTQTGLQAAQQSFVKISQLSLFNYL
jgi:flagellar hook-associated protein 3 FlgL